MCLCDQNKSCAQLFNDCMFVTHGMCLLEFGVTGLPVCPAMCVSLIMLAGAEGSSANTPRHQYVGVASLCVCRGVNGVHTRQRFVCIHSLQHLA